MESVIVLKWKKISLIVPEKQDVDIWYKWMNNIEISKNLVYNFWNVWHKEDEEDFYEEQRKSKDCTMFSIYLNKEKKVIWNISLNKINKFYRNSELWVSIFEEDKLGKWYWSEAIRLVLNYAFEIIGLHKVYLNFVAFNERWKKAYEKVWFKEVWNFKEHNYVMWKYYDNTLMEIFKNEVKKW